MPAFRSVVSVLVSFVGRSFSTNSRPALRAAACGGRPRPATPRCPPPTGVTLHARWYDGDWRYVACPAEAYWERPFPGTAVVFALFDRAIKHQRLYRHRSAGLGGAATLTRLRGLPAVR